MDKKSVFSNLVWRFLERCGAQTVSFVVSIFLARILMPDDYGVIALVTVFTGILGIFIDSGLGTALIQKKCADDLDFSTVFYFNIAACLLLYAGLFAAAPGIAAFYDNPDLTPVVRAIGILLIISGVKNIQHAYISRNMLFRCFFFATLGGTIFSAFLGIALAYAGFGVWALVAQQLSNAAIDTMILWIVVKWRPRKQFSWHRLKGLLSFGWKMLASSLLDAIYNNLRSLVIGKLYSSVDLAYYDRGRRYPDLIVANINASIDSVLLPTLASVQDDRQRVKNMTRRAIKVSTYLMAPLMMGLLFCAEPIVRLILTDKWLPCVPFMRIFCIVYLFYPIHTANLNAITAMGRSDLFLKLEIAKKITGLVILFATMFISVEAMAYSLLVSTVLSMMINSWPNKQLLNYSFPEQMKDILPAIVLAVAMGVCVYFVGFLKLPAIVLLAVQIVFGAVFYIAGSALLKLEAFEYLLGIILPHFRRGK